MKRLIFILSVLISLHSFAQDIPKHANVIIVKGVTFDKVLDYLTFHKYITERIDKEYKTITTKTFHPKFLAGDMFLEIQFVDSTAYVTGIFNRVVNTFNQESQNHKKIENKGWKGSDSDIAFQNMDEIAKGMGGEVSYQIQ